MRTCRRLVLIALSLGLLIACATGSGQTGMQLPLRVRQGTVLIQAVVSTTPQDVQDSYNRWNQDYQNSPPGSQARPMPPTNPGNMAPFPTTMIVAKFEQVVATGGIFDYSPASGQCLSLSISAIGETDAEIVGGGIRMAIPKEHKAGISLSFLGH